MKLSLTATGLLDPKRLDSWVPEKRRAIRKAVEAAMKTAGREIAQIAQARMQSAFKVRKAGFVKSMRHKLYAGSPTKFPALFIGSKIPWLGIHMRGGTIGSHARRVYSSTMKIYLAGPDIFRPDSAATSSQKAECL